MASDSLIGPPPKKIKIAACVHCKAAKRACDEQKPCSRCTQRGLQCIESNHLDQRSSPPLPLDENVNAQLKQLLTIVDEQSNIINNLQFLNSQYYQHIEYMYNAMNKAASQNPGGGVNLPPDVFQSMMYIPLPPPPQHVQVLGGSPFATTVSQQPTVIATPPGLIPVTVPFSLQPPATTPAQYMSTAPSPPQRARAISFESFEQINVPTTTTTTTTTTPFSFTSTTTSPAPVVRNRSMSCHILPYSSATIAPSASNIPTFTQVQLPQQTVQIQLQQQTVQVQQQQQQAHAHSPGKHEPHVTSPAQVVPSTTGLISSPDRSAITSPININTQGAPCSLWDLGTKQLVGCNAAFQLMLGYTLDDLKNDFNITQLVPPRMSAHAVDLFTLLYSMNANGPVDFKTSLVRKDGAEVATDTTIVVNNNNKCAMLKHSIAELSDDILFEKEMSPFATPISAQMAYGIAPDSSVIPISFNMPPQQSYITAQQQPQKDFLDLEKFLYIESP